VVDIVFAVAAADVDCIAHTLDFDALQDNIANIAFCDIEQELVGYTTTWTVEGALYNITATDMLTSSLIKMIAVRLLNVIA